MINYELTDDDSGTEAGIRRREVEETIKSGVATEALMNNLPVVLRLGSLNLLIEQSPESYKQGEVDAA